MPSGLAKVHIKIKDCRRRSVVVVGQNYAGKRCLKQNLLFGQLQGIISQQFQEQSMSTPNVYLFTLELRIRKQLIGLKVFEEDTLSDLITRLADIAHCQKKHSEKLREKLEGEIKRLLTTRDCSAKVKNKLESLTDESKLVIIGVSQTEKQEKSLNETPFRILLESSVGLRKFSAQLSKNKPKQVLDGSPVLSRNYDKTPISQLIKSGKGDLSYAGATSNQIQRSFDYLKPKTFEQTYTNQDYSPITNLNSKRSYKSNNENNAEQPNFSAFPEDKSKREGCILRRQEYYYPHQTEIGGTESFQDYKMKKNKSLNQINRNVPPPQQRQAIYENYKENRAQIRMNYNSKPTENFLKIDYAKVEGGRCNRKFNYLSESNQ